MYVRTTAEMTIVAAVSHRARAVASLAEGDMRARRRVEVELPEAKVEDVDKTAALHVPTHSKIVRFDVAHDDTTVVNCLYDMKLRSMKVSATCRSIAKNICHLVREHEHRSAGELAPTEPVELVQRRSETVHDHDVRIGFHARPADRRDSGNSTQKPIDSGLVWEDAFGIS